MKSKKIILVILFLIIILASYLLSCKKKESKIEEPASTDKFIKTFGGNNHDKGYSVIEAQDGGYVLFGNTSSFNNNKNDLYLIKTDDAGNELWSKTIGGEKDEFGYSVIATKEDGYLLLGYTNSFGEGEYDMYLVKADKDGNKIWSKTFGLIETEYGYSVIEAQDSGYLLLGRTYSFGSGDSDAYLVKTDKDGNELWSKTFGGDQDESGASIAATQDGNYVLLGATYSFGNGEFDIYLVKIDKDGKELWSKTYGGEKDEGGYSVIATKDGGYVLLGTTNSFGNGEYDTYLIKTDKDGKELWSKTYGGEKDECGYSVIESQDGGYVLSGITNSFGEGKSDMYVIKTDKDGNEIWNKTYGGTQNDYSRSVIATKDGGYIFLGVTLSFGKGNSDVYMIKTDSNGETLSTENELKD